MSDEPRCEHKCSVGHWISAGHPMDDNVWCPGPVCPHGIHPNVRCAECVVAGQAAEITRLLGIVNAFHTDDRCPQCGTTNLRLGELRDELRQSIGIATAVRDEQNRIATDPSIPMAELVGPDPRPVAALAAGQPQTTDGVQAGDEHSHPSGLRPAAERRPSLPGEPQPQATDVAAVIAEFGTSEHMRVDRRPAVEPQTEPQDEWEPCEHGVTHGGHDFAEDTAWGVNHHYCPGGKRRDPVAAPVGVDPQEPPTTDDVPFPSCSTCGGDGLCRTCGGSGNDMAGVDLAAAGLTDGQAERIGREPGLGRDGQHNRPDGPTSAAASPVGVDLPAPTQDAPRAER